MIYLKNPFRNRFGKFTHRPYPEGRITPEWIKQSDEPLFDDEDDDEPDELYHTIYMEKTL